MKTRSVLFVLLISVSLLFPLPNYVLGNDNDAMIEETTMCDGTCKYNCVMDPVRITDCGPEAEYVLCGSATNPDLVKETRSLPGETPMNSGAPTRSGRDIWLKDLTITSRPLEKGGIGVSGNTTHFLVTLQNNWSAGGVQIRFKTTRQVFDPDLEAHWQLPVEHKEVKMIHSEGGGSETQVAFNWTPTVSNWFTLNFTAFEPGDPDYSNNHLYLNSYVGAYGDECNGDGDGFHNPTGSFHIALMHDNPLNKAWTHCDEVIPNYCPPGNNTLDIRTIDQEDFDQRYLIFCQFFFTGVLPAGNSHKMLEKVDDGPWKFSGTEMTAAEAAAAGVGDGWFAWFSQNQQGGSYPGMIMNNYGRNVSMRICVGETGGAAKGLYFDDLIIWGVQNYTDDGDFPKINATEIYLDNEALLTNPVEPGEFVVHQFSVRNNGTATVDRVTFDVEQVPEGWDADDIEFSPSSIDTDIAPGDWGDVEVRFTIPADSRASGDFPSDTELNPYEITFSATATGASDPPPFPAEDKKEFSIGMIVSDDPEITVSIDDDNQTGSRGDRLEYVLSIENVGNCELTESRDYEIELKVDNFLAYTWTIEFENDKLEVEYSGVVNVTVFVNLPVDAFAGYYNIIVMASVDGGKISETIPLVAGVEQIFGLEIDLIDEDDTLLEVDPSTGKLNHSISFEIRNKGNGGDLAKIVIESGDPVDGEWFTMTQDAVELGPVGHLDDEKGFIVEFDIPEEVTYGYHNFSVLAISEKDTSGETVTEKKNITITILRPDLEFSGGIGFDPVAPILGETTLISCNIFNNGTAPAADFTVNLLIDDVLVGWHGVDLLDPDAVLELTPFEYVFSEKREYYVKIVLDPGFNVTEILEDNNVIDTSVEVTTPNLELSQPGITFEVDGEIADLLISDQGFFQVVKGTEYTLTIPVKNSGDADAKNVRVYLLIYHLESNDIELDDSTVTRLKKQLTDIRVDSFEIIKAGESVSASILWVPEEYGTEYKLYFGVDSTGELEVNPPLKSYPFVTEPKPETASSGVSAYVYSGGAIIVLLLLGIGVILFLKKRKSSE